MPVTLFYLLGVFIIGSVQSQTWTGIYTTDTSCNTLVCCCFSGNVLVILSTTNTYAVNSGVSGTCSSTAPFTGTAYTNGYSGWLTVGTSNDTLALSSDSNTITLTNSGNSACNGKGLKNGVIKQQAHLSILFAMFLIGTMINA